MYLERLHEQLKKLTPRVSNVDSIPEFQQLNWVLSECCECSHIQVYTLSGYEGHFQQLLNFTYIGVIEGKNVFVVFNSSKAFNTNGYVQTQVPVELSAIFQNVSRKLRQFEKEEFSIEKYLYFLHFGSSVSPCLLEKE